MKKYRIAILIHEKDRRKHKYYYLIDSFIDYWRAEGHEVLYLAGTNEFIPADVILVHVDLSVVPDEYLEFANRYPVVLNNIKDIRKSIFSENLLRRNDDWEGQVIVKTNYNAGGVPEQAIVNFKKRVLKKVEQITKQDLNRFNYFTTPIRNKYDYFIFDRISEVPRHYFYNRNLIVQKFTPEKEKGLYCSNALFFFEDRMLCIKLKGRHPIVTFESALDIEYPVEPSQQIIERINELGFNYGKFDYVISDGKPILLDINKTTGGSQVFLSQSSMKEYLRYGSEALYELIDQKSGVYNY